MLETLRCPNCSTRYGLSASRVRAGIRRAQCFRCDSVFGIEEAVERLLAPGPGAEAPEPLAQPEPPEPIQQPEASDPLEAPIALEALEALEAMEQTLIIQVPPPTPAAEPTEPLDLPPSLNLGDLEGLEEAPYPASGANYASARDAIAKLMGTEPSAPAPFRPSASRNAMDVEATLSALDHTLGGTPIPQPPPAADTSSTVRLSSQEIQAALHSAPPAVPMPAIVRTPVQPSPAYQEPSLPQDPNLLKIQLEQETCNNVTTEQMAAWIEQGRVHEYHMVARQFSDHWIEASKVPALRPIFDQKRRSQGVSPDDLPIPPAEILPPKKSLFGGLFGRN